MAELTGDILQEFYEKTGYPISTFIANFVNFIDNDYPKVVSYFSGENPTANAVAFNNLNSLLIENNKLFETVSLNSNVLNNYKWWVLIEEIENIDTRLSTIQNTSKWLRSSITQVNFTPTSVGVILQQQQTLEQLSRNVANIKNWNDDWAQIAQQNGLEEEMYTTEGGNYLLISPQGSNNIVLRTVVDNIVGDKILGIDLNKKIQFENNDLQVLSPRDTFIQTVQILSQLKLGDNPDYPQIGLNKKFIVGTNRNALSYPTIIRQMGESFSTDDTIKSFSIDNIRRESDALYLDFSVASRIGETQQISILISN
jgi:hypothetical protein